MVIKQKRIQTLKHLALLPQGANFSIAVKDINRFSNEFEKFGFSLTDNYGTKILPSTFNKYARQNSEQYTTIDRSKPKEKYTQTVYLTRTQWAGRGETEEVTEFIDFVRERYHRDVHAPFSVEFVLVNMNGVKSIKSDNFIFEEHNYACILNTINMLLGLFGECSIVSDKLIPMPNILRLNWDILPKGNYPWEKVKESIQQITDKYKNTQRQMMLRNCEEISKYEPDFVAYGRSGFRGYAVFGFESKNLFILESVIPNNATYVFEKNWEQLSQLTKAEILSHNLQKTRIIHNANWKAEFSKVMEGYYE